jgi:multicomponent Na+:H+ antiporter subunit G
MSDGLRLFSAIMALLGAVTILIAMIGVVRFPDIYCRAHALGKGMTLGLSLLLIALWALLGAEVAGTKAMAAVFFQFLTLPVAGHLLALLSFQKRLPRHGDPLIDRDQRRRRPEAP